MTEIEVSYSTDRSIDATQFIDVLNRSTLAARRPVDDVERMAAMVEQADLTVTAWDGELLVGVARSVTDFWYCCYLSDLAVDERYQRRGIGKRLIEETDKELETGCNLILLSAPAAVDYYPHIGFDRHGSAWTRGVQHG